MISYLTGKVLKRMPSGVILDVNGVGYELALPLPTLASLPPKSEELMSFWVYTKVREDAIKLYGFAYWEERQCFEILIQISGVGPKVAMAILSTLDVADLHLAIDQDEPRGFAQVPGIGKRTAEKVLLELKAKRDKLPSKSHSKASVLSTYEPSLGFETEQNAKEQASSWDQHLRSDLRSALENLGFKEKDINPVLKKLEQDHKDDDFALLVKTALKLIAGGGESKRQGARSREAKASPRDIKSIF